MSEPAKASQGQWFPLTGLPTNLIEIQRHMREGYLRGETYSAILENEADQRSTFQPNTRLN